MPETLVCSGFQAFLGVLPPSRQDCTGTQVVQYLTVNLLEEKA